MMLWKIIARTQGWLEARDYDETPDLLVVWHPQLAIHFTGKNAWRAAALFAAR